MICALLQHGSTLRKSLHDTVGGNLVFCESVELRAKVQQINDNPMTGIRGKTMFLKEGEREREEGGRTISANRFAKRL